MSLKRDGQPKTRWSSDEDAIIREMSEKGHTTEEVARRLPGRTCSAVAHRKRKINLAGVSAKVRRSRIETSDIRAAIARGYEQGLSITEISSRLLDELGENLNNNQIIGRAHRMGLKHPHKRGVASPVKALPAPKGAQAEGCRWVTKLEKTEVEYCCGRLYRGAWCEEHYNIVYVPAPLLKIS